MKIGLAVIRAQPFHNGHLALVNKMLSSMDLVEIGLGSSQESGTIQNPWTYDQREEMLTKIFGSSSKIKIFPMEDLGHSDETPWPEFVLKNVSDHGMPRPTHYFAGTRFDACWYEVYARKSGDLQIEILDRLQDPVRATEVRKMLLIQETLPEYSGQWKKHVPEVIHSFVESNFPRKEINFKI